MKVTKTFYIPIQKEVEVKYELWWDENIDNYSGYIPPKPLTDKDNNILSFNTKEEAEKCRLTYEWPIFIKIKEKILE